MRSRAGHRGEPSALPTVRLTVLVASLGPGFGPFQGDSYLTPPDDPGQSVWISWNTVTPGTGLVAWGPSEALGDTLAEPSPGTIHSILVQGLAPDQEYFYRILPSGEIHSFSTFRPPGPIFQSFGFEVIADTRTDSAAHASVVASMLQWDCPLYLHGGDMVQDPQTTSDWQTFFGIEHPLFSTRLVLPTPGNHEDPYSQYFALFPLPGAERWYSLDYGSCHFVSLDTQSDLLGPQKDWLAADLQAAVSDPFTDWIVVFFHRPPFSSGQHGSQIDVRMAWCNLFSAYGVDLVFCGHDHDYERTIPIGGVVYVVSGGGGAPLHPVGTSPWTAYSESCFQHTRVQVSENTLLLEAVRPDGSVFDSAVIQQAGTGGQAAPQASLTAYPNPSSGAAALSWTGASPGSSLRSFDVTGRYRGRMDIQSAEGSVVWSPGGSGEGCTPGIYVVVLETPSERRAVRVVIL